MIHRREFIGALLAGAVSVGGCRGDGGVQRVQPRVLPPDTGIVPGVNPVPGPLEPGSPEAVAVDRELLIPPLQVQRSDALSRIRRTGGTGPVMVVAEGNEGDRMLRRAVAEFGGMGRVVRRGDRVVLSPNFAWARPQDSGVTTSPEIVRTMVQLCQQAGAREVVLLDVTTEATPRAFRVNGAYQAVQGTGARLIAPRSPEQFAKVEDFTHQPLHRTKLGWQAVATVLLQCNVLISMPVLKHHGEVGISGACKKLMGCIWRRRTYHETGLNTCIGELVTTLRPTLSVLDATTVLTENGPGGPGKTARLGRLLVSADPVLCDAYGARLMETPLRRVPYLGEAARLGAGSTDVKSADIAEVSI